MRLFRALKKLERESAGHPECKPAAPASQPVDRWAEFEKHFRESEAIRAEARKRVLEAAARLRELGRNPPRRI